jgi:hypothetical protein
MGFPERHTDDPATTQPAAPPAFDRRQTSQEIRYGQKPGSNHPLHDPSGRRRKAPSAQPAPSGPLVRSDLTGLLGRSVLEAATQEICREYGLLPNFGAAFGSGLSRSYQSRDHGVELAADAHGTIATVFLHFHGDDGYRSYQGEIPGDGGFVGRRSNLWAALGHPVQSGEPHRERFLGDQGPWDRWQLAACQMHAQYALDGETLQRLTLRP